MRVLDLFSGYTVTDCGVIRNSKGRRIAKQVSPAGYERVELWENGTARKYLVHRLVATAFVPNPDNKPQVNHIDGDKLNNDAKNLEWMTQSENQLHAYAIGLQKGYKKSTPLSPTHKAALCGSRWRGEVRVYEAGGLTFETPESAAEYHGVSRQTVYNRSASERFPDWSIKIMQEEKIMPENSHARA